jgi:hypothetical protein
VPVSERGYRAGSAPGHGQLMEPVNGIGSCTNKGFKAITINNRGSVFRERQAGQSFQEPRQVIVIEPSRRDMETPNSDPLAGLQSCMVTESPFLETGRLLESDRVNPAFLPGEWAFQDRDAGASG